MITRQQYLAKQATHREYYAQFVTDLMIRQVVGAIGEKRLLASTDPALNDIPLREWDTLAPVTVTQTISQAMRERGDYPILAGSGSILKEAARQWLDQQIGETDAETA